MFDLDFDGLVGLGVVFGSIWRGRIIGDDILEEFGVDSAEEEKYALGSKMSLGVVGIWVGSLDVDWFFLLMLLVVLIGPVMGWFL